MASSQIYPPHQDIYDRLPSALPCVMRMYSSSFPLARAPPRQNLPQPPFPGALSQHAAWQSPEHVHTHARNIIRKQPGITNTWTHANMIWIVTSNKTNHQAESCSGENPETMGHFFQPLSESGFSQRLAFAGKDPHYNNSRQRLQCLAKHCRKKELAANPSLVKPRIITPSPWHCLERNFRR